MCRKDGVPGNIYGASHGTTPAAGISNRNKKLSCKLKVHLRTRSENVDGSYCTVSNDKSSLITLYNKLERCKFENVRKNLHFSSIREFVASRIQCVENTTF